MTRNQRAQQLWAVLVLAAKNRQVLTYDIVSKATGLIRPSIGQNLDPILNYCEKNNLPPLTILVVQDSSGIPGNEKTPKIDIPKLQQEVHNFDWLSLKAPNDLEFEEASSNTA